MSIAIKRNFTIPSTSSIGASELYLTSSTASTTIGTGALQVAGGAGVSGVISLGGELKFFNGSFYTGFDSAATANTTYIWPATSPSTGTSVLSSDASGNLSWILMSASGSGLTLNGLTATTQYFSTSIAGSGFTISSTGSTHTYYIGLAGNASTGLISGAAQTIFGIKTFASGIAITSGTASTNTTTGDLVVSGGVGIGGTVFTNGLNIQNVFTLGSQVFYPQNTRGFSVNENYNPVGSGASHTAYHFTSGVDRTAIYFDLAISNQYTVMFGTYGSSTGNTFVIGSETANSDFEFRSTVGIQPVRLDLGTLLMRINRSGNVSIPASTASTSTSSGTLTVTGGVGIGGSLWTATTNFSSISGVGHSNSVITSGVWSGTAISAVNGGTGTVSYTTGDILYASSSTTLGKIAAGTAGSVLTSAGAGSTPYWAVATVGSATGLTLNGLTAATQFFATSISGSGFTIGSTGSTHTYYIALAGNASTGLISGAAQTIFGLKTFGSGLAITSGTASTNTTTGALTVAGGVGITGQLSVNTIALGTTAVSITPSMIFTGTAGTVITMSVLSDTTLAWEGSSGQLFSIDNNLSSGEIFSVSDISGLPVITASAGQTITLNEFGGFTQVGNGLASTNTTTGALRVIGGVGITGSLYLGSPLLIPSGGTGLTTYTTGDILYASSSTTLARITAGTAGSVLTSAGAGSTPYWALSTGSGGGITLNGLTASTQTFATSISGSGFTIGSATSTHTFYIGLAGNASTGLISGAAQTIFGLKTFASGLAITDSTGSGSTSTGALTVSGGVGIGGSLNVFGTIDVSNNIEVLSQKEVRFFNSANTFYTGLRAGSSSANVTFTLPLTDGSANQVLYTNGSAALGFTTALLGLNGLTASTQTFSTSISGSGFTIGSSTSTHTFYIGLAGNASTGLISAASQSLYGAKTFVNDTAISSSTASTSTSTGALTVTGGVGIGGSLWTSTTNFSSISGVGHSNSVITSGVWSGTAISAVNGGTGLASYTTGDILHASSSTTLGRISAGTAGSILTSAGTGATPYWAASTGSALTIAGTNNGDIQYKSNAALGASSALNFDASLSEFKLTGFPTDAVSGGSANVKLLGGSVSWSGNINGTMLGINTANTFIGDLFNAQIGGTSRFKVSYTGAVSIGNSYTLPITDGTANQVLKTDGAGSVSWSDSVISSAQYNIGYYASAGTALTGSSTFTNNTSTRVVSIGHTTSSTGFSTGALVVTGGVGIGGTLNIGADLGISGLTTLTYTSEKLNTKTSAGSAGTVTHDLSTGSVFYHSSISNNFTANFTNVPTTNDRALGATLILAQGVTPYMANVLQIDGSAQTIKWVNNTTPTGTASKVDIVGFSFIRTGSAWTVLGQYSTYG
jgi:hypothetical protein